MTEGEGVCEEGNREGADGSSGVWNGRELGRRSVAAGRVREEAGEYGKGGIMGAKGEGAGAYGEEGRKGVCRTL